MRTTFIVLLILVTMTAYARQESYTLLLLDFEDKSSVENPLLSLFNDTLSFGLSRQTGPVQVRLIPKSDRDAFLARAVTMQPETTSVEQGLLG